MSTPNLKIVPLPPPDTATESRIVHIETAFERLTGRKLLQNDRMSREQYWVRWLSCGFTEANLERVVGLIRSRHTGMYLDAMLRFRYLMDCSRFQELLEDANAVVRNTPKPLTERQKVLEATGRSGHVENEPRKVGEILASPAFKELRNLKTQL